MSTSTTARKGAADALATIARRAGAMLGLCAALASPLVAAGPTGYTAWDVSGSDKLLRVDLASGAGTVIGTNIGFGDIDGLAFDGQGQLWGVDDNTNRLVRIDTGTGAGTSVGSFGSGFNDMGLAWGAGTMYMAATDGGGIGKLYTLDLGTGVASLVGTFGDGLKVRSLGFHGGTLYGWSNIDTLLTINTASGVAATVGPFGFSSPTIGQDGMDADPATGMLWAIAEVEDRTYTLDAITGLATIVATHLTCDGGSCAAGGFNGLAIAPVPVPATAPLLLGGVVTLAACARRRTRRAARD